jgi:glycosyltransferase involved in cell wall biosynthesis
MQSVAPYVIVHMNVEDPFSTKGAQFILQGKYYIVLWYKTIPLGDLYIETFNCTNEQLKLKLWSAIKNKIAQNLNVNNNLHDVELAFFSTDIIYFKELLAEVFDSQLSYPVLDKVDISVVICSSNRADKLASCLDSLMKQKYLSAEIIVIDNAPDNNQTKELLDQYPGVKYHREDRPGLDIARNTGAVLAKQPIVAYIDDDVVLHPYWSYRVWETFLKKDVDAMTGLVLAKSLVTASQQIFEKYWNFNKGYTLKTYEKSFLGDGNAARVWDIGAGANMAFRKSILTHTGFFDERLDAGAAGCNGDSEIWHRILLNNYKIAYNPDAVVYHEHRYHINELKKQLFYYLRGHVVAALIQQRQNPKSTYGRYIYFELPKYYLSLIFIGFPRYSFRFVTLLNEIKGIFMGILYYQRVKNTTRFSGEIKA